MLVLYHGTNTNFNEFAQEKARVTNDFYGGGVAYLTDSKNVALTYGKSMTRVKKFGQPIIMTVNATFKKIFDIESDYTGKDLLSILPTNLEQFARSAGLLKFGSDKFDILSRLKSGNIFLTGKQIFMGLSNGMSQTAKARDWLIQKGFDALRYFGLDTSNKHSVYVAFKGNGLKIVKKETLVRKT